MLEKKTVLYYPFIGSGPRRDFQLCTFTVAITFVFATLTFHFSDIVYRVFSPKLNNITKTGVTWNSWGISFVSVCVCVCLGGGGGHVATCILVGYASSCFLLYHSWKLISLRVLESKTSDATQPFSSSDSFICFVFCDNVFFFIPVRACIVKSNGFNSQILEFYWTKHMSIFCYFILLTKHELRVVVSHLNRWLVHKKDCIVAY